MELKIFQVDAFASKRFEGNPAAVVPLNGWLSADIMQSIAAENNLAETAFMVKNKHCYDIRWFTPTSEVKLCGHATLAAAHVLFEHLGLEADEVCFGSLSGPLSVKRNNQTSNLSLDFPCQEPQPCDTPKALINALGQEPIACLQNEDYIAVFESQEAIEHIQPNFEALAQLGLRGVIITAPGKEHDFVARFFAPNYGINEDPVTGSAYTQLAPYWAKRLGKSCFKARQLSARGGDLECELVADRVTISGQAVSYLQGVIWV